ncbi:MAG: hypothetical protein C5B51_28895 [Terriglobia bacterium]|nr:MAG: hypothetical protein C5B51_28895 [Terriglobia bacterium]
MDGPRTPDGKADLAAPTPRMPDGKPDLSGVWDLARPAGAGRGGAQAPATPPAPPPEGPPLATFFNIGANMKDGLPLQPWAAELLNKRKSENSKDNPDAHCLPMGLMQFHMHPQPRKILQMPKEIVIMYEANYGLRQIYLDGRSLPGSDVEPWWFGYSIGHWDGDTLVVETNGYRDDVWLDVWGSPMTSAGKTIERFRRPNFGTMQIDVTIDDPKAYTKPFTVRVNHRLSPDTELIEFICQDRDAPHYVGK